MEEAKIEEWYEQEKNKAITEFSKALSDRSDATAAELNFKNKMKLLHEKYELMMSKNIKNKHGKQKKGSHRLSEKVLNRIKRII